MLDSSFINIFEIILLSGLSEKYQKQMSSPNQLHGALDEQQVQSEQSNKINYILQIIIAG